MQKFLERDGYFDGSVKIIAAPAAQRREHPEWVDLDVRISARRLVQAQRGRGRRQPRHRRRSELFDIFATTAASAGGASRSIACARTRARPRRSCATRGYPAARVLPRLRLRSATPIAKTHRIVLPVQVIEKRKVEVKFVGNRALTRRELRDQLTIFTAGAYDDVELAESAKALQRDYQKHGYFEAQVTFARRRAGADAPDTVEREVTFLIDEGPELKVRAVDIVAGGGRAADVHGADEVREQAGVETKRVPDARR